MVPLTAVPTEFAGRVLVAKLGSAGILAELRGVSRVYPALFGEPHVWVEADEFNDARELITADIDPPFEASDDLSDDLEPAWREPAGRYHRPLMAAVALVLLVSFGYGARACTAQPVTTAPRAR